MKQFVMLYGMQGTFSGHSSIPYKTPPEAGSVHKCILFVRQDADSPDTEHARKIAADHGWTDLVFERTGLIAPESLNSPNMRVFQMNYEECFEYGDSLVWYP